MDRFLAVAEKDVYVYTNENKMYRTTIESAIETLRDALDEEAQMEERNPHLGFDLVDMLQVNEHNRDALRRDNERLREAMGKVASDLRGLAERTNNDAMDDFAKEQA